MKSLKEHRLLNNPIEKIFVDEFIKQYNIGDNCDLIVFGHPPNTTRPKDYLNERERDIVLNTIQWLGSPVGQGFLKRCGFIPQNTLNPTSKE